MRAFFPIIFAIAQRLVLLISFWYDGQGKIVIVEANLGHYSP